MFFREALKTPSADAMVARCLDGLRPGSKDARRQRRLQNDGWELMSEASLKEMNCKT